eukprot:3766342-Prymnesium_polylepis.2
MVRERDVLHGLVQRTVAYLVAVGVAEPQPLLQLADGLHASLDVHVLHLHRVDEAALLDARRHRVHLLERALLMPVDRLRADD